MMIPHLGRVLCVLMGYLLLQETYDCFDGTLDLPEGFLSVIPLVKIFAILSKDTKYLKIELMFNILPLVL